MEDKKKEITELVQQIINAEGKTEREIDELIDLLHLKVPHPAVSDLIFHDDLTVEEIVEKAMSYKPIQL